MTPEQFRDALQTKLAALHVAHGNVGEPPTIILEPGKRYIRLVLQSNYATSRSAYGFIDTTNGDLLKSAGWKTPAKHARGNLNGPDPLRCADQYGFSYLR